MLELGHIGDDISGDIELDGFTDDGALAFASHIGGMDGCHCAEVWFDESTAYLNFFGSRTVFETVMTLVHGIDEIIYMEDTE